MSVLLGVPLATSLQAGQLSPSPILGTGALAQLTAPKVCPCSLGLTHPCACDFQS